MRVPLSTIGRRALLLLMLAGALAGFFLLINFLGAQTSSGPDDLFAARPSQEEFISLPTGAQMIAFTVAAVGLALAVAALSARGHWRLGGRFPLPRWSLIAGALLALLVAGAGLYLATSGMLTQGLAYEEHLAVRQHVKPVGLAVLAAFFLTLAVIGIFVPRLLPVHLFAWLALSLLFGFFGSSALSGLELFNRPWEIEERVAFAAEVEKFRLPPEERPDAAPAEGEGGLLTIKVAAEEPDSPLYVGTRVVAAPAPSLIAEQQFLVAGAEHTRLLRTATGDVYRRGRWTQLDPVSLEAAAGSDITGEAIAQLQEAAQSDPPLPGDRIHLELLVQPGASASAARVDHIVLAPGREFPQLEVGTLPMPAVPQHIGLTGLWQPFSGTFLAIRPATGNQTLSLTAEFAEEELAEAAAVNDPAYLQLPETLPERVRELAARITDGHETPYAKASAIEEYLRTEYSYAPVRAGEQLLATPDEVDPVDWFLFDHPTGRSSIFSSAFVVLARAAGAPARVVSGWSIVPKAEEQGVQAYQAHQWAEIALEDFGWITFDVVAVEEPDPAESGTDGTAGEDSAVEEEVAESAAEEPLPEDLAVALQELSDSLDPEVRADAVAALSGDGSEEAMEGLAAALFNDPHPAIQELALEAFAKADFDLLVRTLLEHPDPLLRMAAGAALGELREERALPPLSQALVEDVDPEVRAVVAEAIGVLGEADGLGPLGAALAGGEEPDERVRESAARALPRLGLPLAVRPLLKALADDPSAAVRLAAVEGLSDLGNASAADGLETALLQDPEAAVREAAAQILGEFQVDGSLPELLQARDEDESPEVRAEAAEALDDYRLGQLTEALLRSREAEVRAAAARLLGERGDPEVVPELIQALNDSEAAVRDAARTALEQMGTITPLENGSGILNHSEGVAFIPGTTTGAASSLPHVPVFEVEGAQGVTLLRTAVGDRYHEGRWIAERQTPVDYRASSFFSHNGFPAQTTAPPATVNKATITLRPAGELEVIPRGPVPISPILWQASVQGTYYLQGMTFSAREHLESYTWTSNEPSYAPVQLENAEIYGEYPYIHVPNQVQPSVNDLAVRIVDGHSNHYAWARAIEQYLRANYSYRLADPADSGPPPGTDPVEWFLFHSREGTCGNFSSAFVHLARAAGIPARVVSGWAIAPTAEAQVVYADQAHQWAEVALDGMGWITFDPTPGGAPGRAPEYSEAGGVEEQKEREEIAALAEELATGDAEAREEAKEDLQDLGATVVETETGGSLVTRGSQVISLAAGSTTAQAGEPNPVPVFVVKGSAHNRYLRTSAGDVYEGGGWRPLDPVTVPYEAGSSVPHLVRDELNRPSGAFSSLPGQRVNDSLVARYSVDPPVTYTDTVELMPAPGLGNVPAGIVPTSQFLDSVGADGRFRPYSGSFLLDRAAPSYTWVSNSPRFSPAQLSSATAVSDPTYTQLPADLPPRIRALAQQVTAGESSVYGKARALEQYLKTNYAYSFADGSGQGRPPPGRDPVDWFLFDYQEGTCGVFSSAFVVMARSIGIPSRVVSGWAIAATPGEQVVKLNQAHQWAEVAFEGLGWVGFEPTAAGSAPTRAAEALELSLTGVDRQRQEAKEEALPPPPPQPIETVIEINQWPVETKRNLEFTIGGTVLTVGGSPVSGVDVEIFINETKEHGGTLIGEVVARNGVFQAQVTLSPSMERGNYQLIAHAVGNDRYVESWSDPGIAVYSDSGMELFGVTEVDVDSEARFQGRVYDDAGAGVPDLELTVSIDGHALPSQSTGPAGEFSFAHTFTEPGPHTVEVVFAGVDLLRGNSARLDLVSLMPTRMAAVSPGQVEVGERFAIEGVLTDLRGSPMAGEEISISVGGAPDVYATTEPDGKFRADYTLDDAGEYGITAAFAGAHPVLPSDAAALVVARHRTTLNIAGPAVVRLGEGISFHGNISSASLPETGSLEVAIEDGEGQLLAKVSTDAAGFFKYSAPSTGETGLHTVAAHFQGSEFIASSSASASYTVKDGTLLAVEGPDLVEPGDTVELRGVLLRSDGQPVAGAQIWRGDSPDQFLETAGDGRFSLQFPAAADLGPGSVEAQVEIPFRFDGDDHLLPALAVKTFAVGIPWLAVEPPETVARGDTATLRGYVFVGNSPQRDATVTLAGELQAQSSATGAFVLRYPVQPGSPLGARELPVSAPSLGVESVTSLVVKATTNLTVVPLERVRPGRQVPMLVTLYDDTGAAIAGATLTNNQGVSAVTDGQGAATMLLTVPDTEGLLSVPVTFSYGGDDTRLPLTYFMGVPVTPTSFNWLLWAVTPALLLAIAAAWFVGRRWGSAVAGPAAAPVLTRVMGAGLPTVAPVEEEEPEEPAPPPEPEVTLLTLTFDKPAADLPAVWAPGEDVSVAVRLSTEDGTPLANQFVEVRFHDGAVENIPTDEQGRISLAWAAGEPGEYSLSASYEGSAFYEPSGESQEFRVVNFREEIVRLYQEFLEWAGEQVAETAGGTPREVEALLVTAGIPLDQRALDVLISRFEEADYSEHSIGRRQYEAMYRAWATLARANAGEGQG